MKKIGRAEFEALTRQTKVLSKDRHGLKVLEAADGRIFKIFRLKRTFSSAQLRPYATRFVEHARILEERTIPSVKVLDHFKVPELNRDVVIYEPMVGKTLRETVTAEGSDCLEHLPAFFAKLHGQGIFFRSIHFGNIIVRPDQGFGLIDVSDMKIRDSALWIWERARNFRHLCKYKADRGAMTEFGIDKFLREYAEASQLRGLRLRYLRHKVIRLV